MTKSTLEKISKTTQWVIIALFIGLLWLPALDSYFHLDRAPIPNEKRAPASFPSFNASLDGIRNFISGLDAYYNDHFGFRKQLVKWDRRWRRDWFKESSLADVVIGRDGWLYYSGERMIENFRGMSQFEPKELKDWQTLLESRRDWLAKRGIRYIFVVTPNKESVYPEALPGWMTKVRPATKLDQFLAYMKANSTVEVVDLRPCLLEAKKNCPVYQFTDTHWNFYGGFVAHQELIRALSHQMPRLEPLSYDQFKKHTEDQPGGDLAVMLGQEKTMLEKDFPTLLPNPELPRLKIDTDLQLIPNKKWPKLTDPTITTNSKGTGKAIVFRDSFSGSWIPFLGYYFNQVFYLWEYHWEPAFIEQEKPEVVIDEMLERFLYKENATKLKNLDALQ
ncbi:alginate O-acetyltransferase AlgX-related protein [Pedosphaera parvula]|uniref:AlgX/AlgJ SGNH hydrolase-like domain-containing protein n=1 Tax=Pedosphaera parvula (strain Ellin514) TaxID=320771 RepID=B9XPM3_PEDPL|nr:alginate O-acetyltransferase [Pedosphaera parvula]EEF58251.1 hypothetical protein Cflav_PD1451 [Pedosphaera parvula Ellin514]